MMKNCAKCGELNGSHADRCFKCGHPFPPNANYQKVCPRCGLIYSSKAETCERCSAPLSVQHSPPVQQSGSYGGELRWWMILVCVLWPIVGLLVGFGIRSSDDTSGGRMIRLSLIVFGVSFVFGLLMGGCSVLFS